MKTLTAILVVSFSPIFSLTTTAQEGSSMIIGRGQRSNVSVSPAPGYRLAGADTRTNSNLAQEATSSEASRSTTTPAFPNLSATPSQAEDATDASGQKGNRIAGPAITVTSSLAVVLGLFAALIWLTRKFGGRSGGQGTIPKDVVQNLGSVPIDPRTQVTLLRCGQRILIVARTNTGIHALGEITNPEEVSQLTAACLGNSKQAFASALQSIESEPSGSGYLGEQSSDSDARARGRLFATA